MDLERQSVLKEQSLLNWYEEDEAYHDECEQAFEGLSATNDRHLAFLVSYARDELMPDVSDFITENVAIYEDENESPKARLQAQCILGDALLYISRDYLHIFLEKELAWMGRDKFYRTYGISNPYYLT